MKTLKLLLLLITLTYCKIDVKENKPLVVYEIKGAFGDYKYKVKASTSDGRELYFFTDSLCYVGDTLKISMH